MAGGGISSLLQALGSITGKKELGLAGQGVGLVSSLIDGIGSGFSGGSGLGLAGGALSLMGGLSGSKGVSQLGSAIGGIPAAATIVGGALSGTSMAGALAGLSANPYTAAIAAAITQIMDMYSSIDAGYSGEHTFLRGLAAPIPIAGEHLTKQIDKIFLPSDQYTSFPDRVAKTAHLEGSSLGALIKGMPYIQSQKELSDAISAFKSEVGSRVGGYGEGSDPFSIPNLPGIGARTHGFNTGKSVQDFGPAVNQTQEMVNALRGLLPETFAAPAGDNAQMRNFAQFQDSSMATPQRTYDPSLSQMYIDTFGSATPELGGQRMIPGTAGDPSTWDQVSRPNQGAYNFSAPGAYPDPTKPVTAQKSSAWQSLMAPRPTTGPAPTTGPVGPIGPRNGPAGPGGVAPLGSSGFASLRGPQSELLTAEDPNRL
jgi:hypothetical protein